VSKADASGLYRPKTIGPGAHQRCHRLAQSLRMLVEGGLGSENEGMVANRGRSRSA